MPIGLPEFVDNLEPRCPVILLCDTSGSMSGAPINALMQGLRLSDRKYIRMSKRR